MGEEEGEEGHKNTKKIQTHLLTCFLCLMTSQAAHTARDVIACSLHRVPKPARRPARRTHTHPQPPTPPTPPASPSAPTDSSVAPPGPSLLKVSHADPLQQFPPSGNAWSLLPSPPGVAGVSLLPPPAPPVSDSSSLPSTSLWSSLSPCTALERHGEKVRKGINSLDKRKGI